MLQNLNGKIFREKLKLNERALHLAQSDNYSTNDELLKKIILAMIRNNSI